VSVLFTCVSVHGKFTLHDLARFFRACVGAIMSLITCVSLLPLFCSVSMSYLSLHLSSCLCV